MTNVITVPPSLDDHSFEQVLEQVAPLPADAKILVDARHARWASPYGLTALLTLAQTRTERPAFAVPEQDETASYWARAAFFHHADSFGLIRSGRIDVTVLGAYEVAENGDFANWKMAGLGLASAKLWNGLLSRS